MKLLTLIISCLFLGVTVFAQDIENDFAYPVNESTMIGFGSATVKDTYLSPFNYTGWGFRILNERTKIVKLANYNVSRQQFLSVDISSTENPAENVNDFGGFVDYSLGYHYRFKVNPNLKIYTGGAAHLMGGFLYNTRNGNNPLSAKIDFDLNFSAMIVYGFRIKNNYLTLRYQGDVPFAGVLFSPHYNQSYYEIFNLGNTEGIIRFNSFHNKFALKNYLTLDIPVKNFTIRTGYLNSLYYTDVNELDTRIITHSFMIGIVKEFISLGGKKVKQRNVKSCYY